MKSLSHSLEAEEWQHRNNTVAWPDALRQDGAAAKNEQGDGDSADALHDRPDTGKLRNTFIYECFDCIDFSQYSSAQLANTACFERSPRPLLKASYRVCQGKAVAKINSRLHSIRKFPPTTRLPFRGPQRLHERPLQH